MSTEYERTVHSDKSTEDAPLSEHEASSESWQGDRDETETERVASESETGYADHAEAGAAPDDGDSARADTDLDVEPEHVSTTEYGEEHATATEYGAERATSANAGEGSATTADYEAQPAETTTADYDYDAQPTTTSEAEADQATTTAGEPAADQVATAGESEADQVTPVTTPDQSTTSGNGAERQQTSLDDVGAPLFADTDLDQLRTQWREVQGTFVDNPRDAVTQADQIVTDIIYKLTTAIAERKRVLEERTSGATDGDTEELRQALRGYRGFFRRLLSIES
ncbi:hypothetical protein ACFWF7_14135 [Nocardia sp. NPDC060256]|uniref:hypothetical protein n=1 Tax=unclassified Nocardia TaxID=2637762 RepID=UPI00365CE77D